MLAIAGARTLRSYKRLSFAVVLCLDTTYNDVRGVCRKVAGVLRQFSIYCTHFENVPKYMAEVNKNKNGHAIRSIRHGCHDS